MGAAMRAHNWSASCLGPVERWPQPLKTAVAIMLNAKFPMFIAWGEELTFLYNDGYSEILGDKHPAALGSRFEDIWSEIWTDIHPIIEKALAGEGSYFEDLPLVMNRRGAPEQTWFTFTYAPLRDEGGAVAGMFCIVTETTQKVLAERRHASEIERLRELFDHAPAFMAVLRGSDHVFELANRSYLQLVGRSDILGLPVREALPDLAGQGFFELLDQVYGSGEPFTGSVTPILLRRSPESEQEERFLNFVYQPIRDAAGQVNGIFVVGYDVTVSHLAEQRLRESEERFRLIADSAPVPIWVSRLDRKRGFVNRAYVEFLGISYEEATDFDWRTVLHPDDHDRIVAESIAGEASLKPFVLEARYRSRGEWRWIQSMSQPRWGPDGKHIGFIGVAHDITEAKEAEQKLRDLAGALEQRVTERTADLSAALERLQEEVAERQRAEDALRQAQKMEAVGQLTGGIAHDFNNLLTPVIGGLELISRRLEEPRLQRIAGGALESARRGAKLATQLLAFSRLQRISMSPVDVNKVVGDLQRMLHHTLGPRISIAVHLGEDAGHAMCDVNQLENAIINLAINARDAMPEGGTLTISTALHHEKEEPDLPAGEYACITVADTGHGMSADVAARAMEPFFSTKPVGKGTGLGLAQVYGIARQSGGTARIESREGEGTSVHLLLPHVAAPGVVEEGAGGGEPRREQAHVGRLLVVDDDPDVRTFLTEALRDLGHEVVACEGPEEGLARLAEAAPDLVLLDFAMPGMNGADVARQIIERAPGTPILFVTGYAETDQIVALGADVGVVRKPFSIADLAATIHDRLAEGRLA